MNISPTEAEEALHAIQEMARKTRRALSSSGSYIFFIIWGVVWMIGFLGNQFLPDAIIRWLWLGIDLAGGLASWIVGMRMNRAVRSPATGIPGKRLAWFWILLLLYMVALIGVVWPIDVRQIAVFIVMVIMIGWLAMGLLLSFVSIRITLAITAVTLLGYFLLPDYFHLLMAFVCGGGLVAFGLYIRLRW